MFGPFRRAQAFRRESFPIDARYGLEDLPTQFGVSKLAPEEAEARLAALEPEIAWACCVDFGGGVHTVGPEDQTAFRKAVVARHVAQSVVDAATHVTRRGRIDGLRVLDIACGEGSNAIELAARGATAVGVDGRQLHVERASFVAEAFGLDARFEVADCRRLDPARFGDFDLLLFYGILHHLGPDDFVPMLRLLRKLTNDALIIFMHLGRPDSPYLLQKLGRQVTVEGRYTGYLWREHPAGASIEAKAERIRNSLDNEFSFWPDERSVLDALQDVGFGYVSKILHPHVFGDPTGDHRVFLLCKP